MLQPIYAAREANHSVLQLQGVSKMTASLRSGRELGSTIGSQSFELADPQKLPPELPQH